MKKLILVILLVSVVGLIFTGCDGDSGGLSDADENYTIKVSGTDGLEFSGGYMAVTSDGKSVYKSVDGVVPAQYSVSGTIISCSFQKLVEAGTLKVEILKSGQVVAEDDTSAAYGVVAAATD